MTQGPKRQPEKSPSLRVAGVNTPQIPNVGQSPEAQQTVQLPDNTSQKTQEVIEANNAAFEAVSKANEAAATSKMADLAAKGHGEGAQRFGAALESVANTVSIIQKRQQKLDEKEREMRKEQLKEWRDRQSNVARTKLNKEFQSAQQVIREEGLKQGIQAFRESARKVLEDYRGKLSPSAFQELQDFVNSNLNTLEQDLTKRQKNQADELKSKQNQIRTEEIKMEVSGLQAQLENASTAEEAQNISNKLIQKVYELAPSAEEDPRAFVNVALPILKDMSKSSQASAEARAESASKVEAIQNYEQRIAPYIKQYNQGEINKDTLKAKQKKIAADEGEPQLAGKIFRTNDEKKRDMLQMMQTQKKIRNLQQSDESPITNEQLKELSYHEYGRLLFDYRNGNKDVRNAMEEAARRDNGKAAKTFLKLDKELEEDRQEYMSNEQKIWDLEAEIADTGIEYRQILLGGENNNEIIAKPQYDRTSQRVILPRISDNVDKLVEQGKIGKEKAKRIKKAIRNQKGALLRRQANLDEKWSKYGLNIKDLQDDSALKEQKAVVEPVKNSVQSSQVGEDQRNMSGTNKPNPKKGVAYKPDTPKATSLAKKNGVTMPFKKEHSSQITVTSEYGQRVDPNTGEQNDIHNGIDIAAPKGTKVQAIQGGTVVGSRKIRGHGQTVLVKTPDGHTEQYSHLKSRNVSEGDVITPGESVGKVGDTGNATGSVLHMQVWQDDPSWGTAQHKQKQTIDPMKYLNQVKFARPEPRGKGPPQNQQPKKASVGNFQQLGDLSSTPVQQGEGTPAPVSELKPSNGLAQHIAASEGFRSQAYRDLGDGEPIAGYGFKRVDGKKVKMGDSVTREQANRELVKQTNSHAAALNKHLPDNLQLTQGQYDALVDMTYNIGPGAIAESTLMDKLHQYAQTGGGTLTEQQQQEIAQEIRKWNKDGNGKALAGLTKRREANAQMFLNNRYEPNPMEAYGS